MRGLVVWTCAMLVACGSPAVSGHLGLGVRHSTELLAAAGKAEIQLHNVGPGAVRLEDLDGVHREVRLEAGEAVSWPGPIRVRVSAEGRATSVRFESRE